MSETSVSFSDYINAVKPQYNYNNQIAISEITGSGYYKEKTTEAVRMDAFSAFLICQGESQINIDYLPYKLKKNMVLVMSNFHILEDFGASPDFKGYSLIVSKDLMLEIVGDIKNIPMIAENERMLPIKTLNNADFNHLVNIIHLLQKYISEDHIFKNNIIKYQFGIFLFDMVNIFLKNKKDSVLMKEANRKEEIAINFLKLLRKHSREKHEVTFYSNELCITSEYLSKIMKAFSGKSANKWISEALIIEAKILLRKPNTSIQQISDTLNFSEQSSFSKFFKKHTGKSPLEYKNSTF